MAKQLPALVLLLFFLFMTGCAEDPYTKKNDVRSIEQRLQQSQQYLAEHPLDKNAKVQMINDKYRRINQLFNQADGAYNSGNIEQARAYLQNVLELDPNNPRALDSLKRIDTGVRHSEQIAEARQMLPANPEGARLKLREVLLENPGNSEARSLFRSIDDKINRDLITPRKLKIKGAGTVSLDFRDANLRNIFEVISKTSGINIVLDPNVRPDIKASIFVKDASVEDAIDFLLLVHQLSKKVLTDNSLLIFPSSRASQYDDLILRSFYLNHADAKQTVSLIKTMHPIRDVFIDEKLNMFSIRATYEQLASIEKLIADEDLPDPEVLLDVEVLEVRRSHLTDIGIIFPDTLSVLALGTGIATGGASTVAGATTSGGTTSDGTSSGVLTLQDLKNINSRRIGISPDLAIRLLRQDGENNLLANPRIRVKNREKAKILIGDKIPILTTTVAANSNFASRSANYLDVGLKLDVEPRVMLNNEVSIRISLEVSNASFTASSEFPTIGTRNTSTVLMTGDGETQVLAGLINDEDRKTISKVPGLSSLPIIGRLFTDPRDDRAKTEIVLLITPHVVRNFQRPDAADTEFYSTTGSRTAPLNISPAAVIQQMTGVPLAPPAAPAPNEPNAPAPNAPNPASPNAPAPYNQPSGTQEKQEGTMPAAPAPAAPAAPNSGSIPPGGSIGQPEQLQQLGKPVGSQ